MIADISTLRDRVRTLRDLTRRLREDWLGHTYESEADEDISKTLWANAHAAYVAALEAHFVACVQFDQREELRCAAVANDTASHADAPMNLSSDLEEMMERAAQGETLRDMWRGP